MNIVAEMLLQTPTPAAIWAALMLLTLPALVLLASPQAIRQPRTMFRQAAATLAGSGRLPHLDTVRYAEEMRVASTRADQAADRWAEFHDRTVEAAERAWQAWQDAESRLVQTRAAAAWGTPSTPQTPEEYASRERFLHRAVEIAVVRGELPKEALADALAGEGWDASLHPADQELVIHQAAAAYLRAEYRRAAEAERVARHDADLSHRSREALRAEATVAAIEAVDARRTYPSDDEPAHLLLSPATA
jgi:hypothetical protein